MTYHELCSNYAKNLYNEMVLEPPRVLKRLAAYRSHLESEYPTISYLRFLSGVQTHIVILRRCVT